MNPNFCCAGRAKHSRCPQLDIGLWLVFAVLVVADVPAAVGQALDTTVTNVNGNIRVMALQPDNKIVIGGEFTTVNGTTRNHIARLNADGSLDTSFDAAGVGADNWVLGLAVQSDGKIVVGGAFANLGGSARSHLGRLNGDGTLDTGFNPGANDWVWGLSLVTNAGVGKIIVGGGFYRLGGGGTGTGTRTNIGLLTLTGALDPAVALGASAQVNKFLVQDDGKVLVGGFFTNLLGVARQRIARLNADGTLDLGFAPSLNGPVWNFAKQPFNTILAVGDFTAVGAVTQNRIARFDLNGNLDLNFNPGANSTVNPIVVQPDGRTLVGGNFTNLAGTACNYLGRLNTDGTLDTSFTLAPNGTLLSMVAQLDGRVLISGAFTSVSAQSRNRAARITFLPNDNFSSATVITGMVTLAAGSNIGATLELGETNHAGVVGGSSVWWRWTAPSNSVVTLAAVPSFPEAELAVYTGNTVSSLNPIASKAVANTPLSVTFNATASTTYQIAVDGHNGATGSIYLHLEAQPIFAPPSNDSFSSPTVVSSISSPVIGSNVGASTQAGEPDPYNGLVLTSRSVWWSWLAPSNQVMTIDTYGSSFDTALLVYTGSVISSITQIAKNDDDGGLQSRVTFSAVAGTTYRVGVYGVNGGVGDITLHFQPTPPPPYPTPPANNALASAIVVSGVSNQYSTSNLGATSETGENPAVFNASGDTLWWAFNPANDGILEVDGKGSSIPLVIEALQGTSFATFNSLQNNYAGVVGGSLSDYLFSKIRVPVQGGQNYRISGDGFLNSAGNFKLGFFFIAPPVNNNFANRITINPGTNVAFGSNLGASAEASDPSVSSNSVWWSWTPTQSQSLVLTTFGSSFDTVLSVYTNATLATLALVASNDNAFVFDAKLDPASRVHLDAVASRTYQLGICGSTGADSGDVTLNFVTVALDDILASQRVIRPDRSVDFEVSVRLKNYRVTGTGPLRVRLVARAGYSCNSYLQEDLRFLETLNVPDVEIGRIDLPIALGAGASSQALLTGHCPPPYEAGKWGFGEGILAILEEQVSGSWQFLDGRLILVGEWPAVGGQLGPGGGVITITSPFAGTPGQSYNLQVNFGPPSAIRLGGAWRVSPTNYGEKLELRFFTNYMTTSTNLTLKSTNFTIEARPVAGFNSPANRNVLATNGTTTLDLFYSVFPPYLVYNAAQGLGLTGIVNTAYRIESSSTLGPSATWSTLSNSLTLLSGTNWVQGTTPSALSNRFHRAVWLQN